MSENVNDPGLKALEAGLQALTPRAPGLNRDALMFRAGQASAQRRWVWPLTTAASTLVAVGLGVFLALRPEPAPRVVTVYVQMPESSPDEGPPVAAPGKWAAGLPRYSRLVEDVWSHGLDGLPPEPNSAPDKPAKLEDLLRSL
jgi:hypothetical protein